MQIRADRFSGDRPDCPRGCSGRVHRHGHYFRYAQPSGNATFRVPRFLCPRCRLPISVLPVDRLPYRSVAGPRLEAHFNEQAEAGAGSDPPPDALEAGCLRRAWTRFQTRVVSLQEAFGLLLVNLPDSPGALWQQMRQAKGTLPNILAYLAQTRKVSLLADYRCLRVPL